MPYTHFRYIAYEVPTATTNQGTGGVESGFSPGVACPPVPRLPVPDGDGLDNDANIRLRRLAAVVDRAATNVLARGDDNNSILKIFVAPEFYFRPPRATGLEYQYDTYPQRVMQSIWGAFNSMFQHVDFSDWLFIPGTVMWNNSDLRPGDNVNYFNSAFHILGGPPPNAQQGRALRVEKQLPSNIDGIPAEFAPGEDDVLHFIYEEWRNRKERVFSLDATCFGLEVCLDHHFDPRCRVLKTLLSEWERQEHHPIPDVSLHILSAGGMSIQPRSVSARVNGYILRNDGLPMRPRGEQSELIQVMQYTAPDPFNLQPFPTIPSDLNGTATLGAAVPAVDDMILQNNLMVPSKGPNFSTFEQRIVFYPPLELPRI